MQAGVRASTSHSHKDTRKLCHSSSTVTTSTSAMMPKTCAQKKKRSQETHCERMVLSAARRTGARARCAHRHRCARQQRHGGNEAGARGAQSESRMRRES
jgi:hypothetical protein